MKKILWIGLMVLAIAGCQNTQKKQAAEKPEAIKKEEAKETSKPSFDKKAYKMKGMIIAKSTFKTFKSKIKEKAAQGGLPAVVNFCHENAMKLTDSMGKAHNVIIKRTSHKLRNPQNKPDIDEEAVLNEYLKLQEENKPMEPVVLKDSKGFVHFYAPIKLKKECLKCHGTPGKEIPDNIFKLIKTNYPEDQATGFKEGDLRGIWDIKFLKK